MGKFETRSPDSEFYDLVVLASILRPNYHIPRSRRLANPQMDLPDWSRLDPQNSRKIYE